MGELIDDLPLPGLIADGAAGTPWIAATLSMDQARRLIVEVPFVQSPDAPQFDALIAWFEDATPIRNLALLTRTGGYSLIDCSFSRAVEHRAHGLRIGTIRPKLVVGELPTELSQDPVLFTELRSRTDGLDELADFSAFDVDLGHERGSDGERHIAITLPTPELLSWRQGEAMMTIGPAARWASSARVFELADAVHLTSYFPSGAEFETHLAEQRKVTSLIALLCGSPPYFRGHEVRDGSFPERFLSGEIAHFPFHRTYAQATIQEHYRPDPAMQQFRFPVFGFGSVVPDDMEQWDAVHQKWSRAIGPLVEVLSRKTTYEDFIISTYISIEASGNLIGPVAGEEVTHFRGRPTTTTYAFRCLMQLPQWDMPLVASPRGLAKFLANTYNSIKHFDRETAPTSLELRLAGRASFLAARVVILHQIRHDRAFLESRSLRNEFRIVAEEFASNRVKITDDGHLVPIQPDIEERQHP